MWIFEQSSGTLYGPRGNFVAVGYSGGDGGKQPDGINNQVMQNKHNIGPIPAGLYQMQAQIYTSRIGPCAIPLSPDPRNKMFGRSGFYCHGDNSKVNRSASDGCIIMPRAARDALIASADHLLLVTGNLF